MRSINDLWEVIGTIPEEETPLVLARLFAHYEEIVKLDPDNSEAHHFFQTLDNTINQTIECNLNRR